MELEMKEFNTFNDGWEHSLQGRRFFNNLKREFLNKIRKQHYFFIFRIRKPAKSLRSFEDTINL